MNYVKNEFRTALTDITLNVCMAVALDERNVSEFPFVKVLDHVVAQTYIFRVDSLKCMLRFLVFIVFMSNEYI